MQYNIIYADPPWSFGSKFFSSSKKESQRHISQAYSVMRTADICELNVGGIAAEDCALFMWTTDAHIPDALMVMRAWGFKYKTVAFVWQKKELSGKQTCYMGQWTMKNCELVLLATKGKMSRYLISRKVRQLQEAPREFRRHSKKPDVIRQRIVEMFGDELPKVELFARTSASGWDAFGNEIDNGITLPPRLGPPKQAYP